MKLYFCPTTFHFSADPTSYHYERQEYLVLFLCSQNLGILVFDKVWTRLLVNFT